MMLRVVVVCCVIGFVSSHLHLNSTVSDVEINGTVVRVSEQVTNSDIVVSEAELATASTQIVSLNPISIEDFSLSSRQCPSGSSKPCVVKCCPLGESIGDGKICEPSTLKFKVPFYDENGRFNATDDDDDDGDYDFIFGNPCCFERYRLEPHSDSCDEFRVLRNGSLSAPYLFPDLLTPNDYCLEMFGNSSTKEEKALPLVCFPESQITSHIQYILYPIGLLISVPFLIITMLVYCLIPELRDLHGKTLVCYVLCLTVAYIFLATVQLVGETLISGMCVVVAFIIQFSFLACFCWLNVLSINSWWNVLANVRLQRHSEESRKNRFWGYVISTNNEVNMPKGSERKFFFFYSLYAWCFPFFLLAVSVAFDLLPIIPSSYLKPNMGDNKCWFSSEEAELPYFYGPVTVTIFINIVLFIFTSCRVYRHWRATRQKPRQIFRMCLCLFCVMGINWVMEVVSWFAGGPEYIWYVTDVINTLQGIIIFIIFVLEPRIRSCVWKKLGPKLSRVLFCSQSPHANIVYCAPEDAAV